MALKFGQTKGSAASNKVEAYEYKDNENVVRLIGDILPRYMYWLKGTNNKDIPVECLSFDREQEKFTNIEKDHVRDFYPDLKCSWSYAVNCIDVKNGKVVALNLKKKLFQQIISAAEDLGDPTDPDTGWDVVFKRVKTGPLPFNVEYNLQVLKCKHRPLTEAEREMVAEAKSIDEKYPRPSAQDIKALLDRIHSGNNNNEGSDDAGSDATPEEARDL